MKRRKLLIIIIIAIITILYPSLIWAENTETYSNKTPTVYFTSIKNIQSPTGVYCDFNIGVGFLYFSKLRGNLSPIPPSSFSNFSGANFGNTQKFSYNKTPLFEGMISARMTPWLKGGLSFYGQSNVAIESFGGAALTSSGNTVWSIYRSNLQLYALMFKIFVESPAPLIVGSWAINSYFGMGVGPGWQSWTNNQIYEMAIVNSNYTSSILSLNNKFSANAVWTADAGIWLQPATDQVTMMIKIGCKFTDWGQMRQVGSMKDQSVKVGPFKPIQARVVYSFAPYIGVRWCF